MRYFSIKEVSEQLNIREREVYRIIKDIEDTTPHRFGRMFRGNYYRAKERKEKVVSKRDLLLLIQIQKVLSEKETITFDRVIQKCFGSSE